MGKKWVKVDPADIKVGDRVKLKYDGMHSVKGTVSRCTNGHLDFGDGFLRAAITDDRAWYVRKTKPVKPLPRPIEPPVGSFFRVDRTGGQYQRSGEESYYSAGTSSPGVSGLEWDEITEPGDTITILELTEVGDKRDADA